MRAIRVNAVVPESRVRQIETEIRLAMLTTDDLPLVFAVNSQFFMTAGAIDVIAFEVQLHDGLNDRQGNEFRGDNRLWLKFRIQQAAATAATNDSRGHPHHIVGKDLRARQAYAVLY